MDGFKALQPATGSYCLYVSTSPVFPYPSAPLNAGVESTVTQYCAKHHLRVAYFENEADMGALADVAGEMP